MYQKSVSRACLRVAKRAAEEFVLDGREKLSAKACPRGRRSSPWARSSSRGRAAHRARCTGRIQLVVATPRWWRCRVGTMRERQREVQLYRGQVPSPGRPTVAWREDRVRFWAAVARGLKTEDAAGEAGVSSPVAFRWFRHAGGVNPCLSPTVSGRYLSFGEREEIALLRAQGRGVREIARRLESQPVDDLAGAAPERVDADVAARVQGVDRAVARRASCPPTKGGQAGRERAAPRVRAGTAVGWSARRRRSSCRAAGAEVERSEQAASRGSPLGAGLEPGADREPAAGRVPR